MKAQPGNYETMKILGSLYAQSDDTEKLGTAKVSIFSPLILNLPFYARMDCTLVLVMRLGRENVNSSKIQEACKNS